MISALTLNYDVLEAIFSYLEDSDSVAISLVCKSFLRSIIPKMFAKLKFGVKYSEMFRKFLTPLKQIIVHPTRAKHVRSIEIYEFPSTYHQPREIFLQEFIEAFKLCENIRSFTCTLNCLDAFLPGLVDKDSLKILRVNGSKATQTHAELLSKVDKLTHLTIDSPSWELVDVLSTWVPTMQSSLTHLTIFRKHPLNEDILERVLSGLPRLIGLHILNCPKINPLVLFCLCGKYTPLLESLAFTTNYRSRNLTSETPPFLPHLRHLAIELQGPSGGTSGSSLLSIFKHLKPSSAAITSLKIRIPDAPGPINNSVIDTISTDYGQSIKSFSLISFTSPIELLSKLCVQLINVEQLELALPAKEVVRLRNVLTQSKKIQTLVDCGEYESRLSLTSDDARFLIKTLPTLSRIYADGRIWTERQNFDDEARTEISLKRQPAEGVLWFLPQAY